MAFQIARITDPGALAHVSPKFLIDLIREKAPLLLLRLKKSDSDADILTALNTLRPADEADALIEVLHGIDRIVCADSVEELLVAKGIPVNDATLGDALANAAIYDPYRFEGAVDLATVRHESKGSTFTVFRGPAQLAMPALSTEIEIAFREACASKFAELGHGSHCVVRRYEDGADIGFLVDHGGLRRTTRTLNESDIPETRTGRPVRHDVVLINTVTRELRVLARAESERVFYARTLGDVLFGSAHPFVPAEKYVLDAVLSSGYRAVLQGLTDGDIQSVTLRDVRLASHDDWGTRHNICSKDALQSLTERSAASDDSTVAFARFAIVPRIRHGRRHYRLSVWKGCKRNHDSPWSDAAIEQFIERLQLRRALT